MKASFLTVFLSLLLLASLARGAGTGGAQVSLDRHEGPAVVSSMEVERFRVRFDVARNGEDKPLAVRIHLPVTGRDTWPVNDVEVRDAEGRALLVQRSGIVWEKLVIPLPEGVNGGMVQAVEPPGGWPEKTRPEDREIRDGETGAWLRVAHWPEGRTAALSLRFDDSHPTHLSKAIPILREDGFRGTFMVNPGPKEPGSRQNFAFETQRAEWEEVMRQGDHELANHSAHHRGARGDEEMDAEIGSAARVIRELSPGRSPLMALNLGGGTRWETTRTLRHYLEKYHQFDASSGSLGMDDSYGGRVEAFRQAVERHLERGLWCRVHFHSIGEGLGSSEANFRAVLDIASEHQERLWIAGMADIHKYQTERDSSALRREQGEDGILRFRLECGTNPDLYDEPLTLECGLPAAWQSGAVTVRDEQGAVVPVTRVRDGEGEVLRFRLPPRSGAGTVSRG